jgi:phosphatidylglycerol:prolipoprotein diacylglycerol transferase
VHDYASELRYSACVALALLVGWFIRRKELARLGYTKHPRHSVVGLGSLFGAVLGSKLGLILFVPPASFFEAAFWWSFDGKTVIGALIGGYLGGELTKKLVGVRFSTGDGWAISLPVAQAIGRVGCFVSGCCYGTETGLPCAVWNHGAWRHPAPLYEAALLLVLALVLFLIRKAPRPAGHLFRYYFIGYAALRFLVEFVRGDEHTQFLAINVAQWACLLMAGWMLGLFAFEAASAQRTADRAG